MAITNRKVAPCIRERCVDETNRSYEFNASAGTDGNGKPVRKYTTFTVPIDVPINKADKMATEAYFEFSHNAQGNKSWGENMRFNTLVEQYFKLYAPTKLKEVTAEHYLSNIRNHIAPVFGNRKLKDIGVSDVTEFLSSIKRKPSTVHKIKIVFHSVMKFAVSQNFIKKNPCVGVNRRDPANKEYGEIENVLTLEQARKLISILSDKDGEYFIFNTIVKLLVMTGMRSGECLGLRWSSIDFEKKTIFIDKTLSFANNHWFLSTPKTPRSTRTIAMDDVVVDLLKKHREEQNKQKEIVGNAWQHPELVFTSCTGHWYDRSLLNAQFRRFIRAHKEELKLDHNLTIHGLRHTNAALLLFAGEDIENISAHLGHASSDITSRVYAHMYAEVRVRVAKTVSNALHSANIS